MRFGYFGKLAQILQIKGDYPQKVQEIKEKDELYWKKGDKINYFCIAGAKDEYFEAQSIEMFGLKLN